jgi:hypothetical protein
LHQVTHIHKDIYEKLVDHGFSSRYVQHHIKKNKQGERSLDRYKNMEVSLRKAKSFSESLITMSRALPLTNSISISIYSETAVVDQVAEAQSKLKTNRDLAVSLLNAGYAIRKAIGEANAFNGVDALLTEKASLDAIEKLLAGVSAKSSIYDEDEADLVTAQAQLAALRAREQTGVDRYGRSSALSVNIVSAEISGEFQNQLADIRRRKIAVADELLGINLSSKITLSDDTVALLTEFKLI